MQSLRSIAMAEHPSDDLNVILEQCWAQLTTAVDTGKHGFHLPTLCTVDAGGLPAGRILVLRAVDPGERTVMCHTDVRSPKVTELCAQPMASWVFYDADARLQLRATGRVSIHTDDALAQRRWEASNESSRRCYLAPAAPGALVDQPSPNLPEAVRQRVPEKADTEPGRANFAVLQGRVDELDYLHLHHAGHRRARFTWNAPDRAAGPTMTWLEV